MKEIKRNCLLTLVRCLFCFIFIIFFNCFHVQAATTYGTDAYTYMTYLNDNYPDRVQNTQQVRNAGPWIKQTLEYFGYTVETFLMMRLA